jgi:hypothetical protein
MIAAIAVTLRSSTNTVAITTQAVIATSTATPMPSGATATHAEKAPAHSATRHGAVTVIEPR